MTVSTKWSCGASYLFKHSQRLLDEVLELFGCPVDWYVVELEQSLQLVLRGSQSANTMKDGWVCRGKCHSEGRQFTFSSPSSTSSCARYSVSSSFHLSLSALTPLLTGFLIEGSRGTIICQAAVCERAMTAGELHRALLFCQLLFDSLQLLITSRKLHHLATVIAVRRCRLQAPRPRPQLLLHLLGQKLCSVPEHQLLVGGRGSGFGVCAFSA